VESLRPLKQNETKLAENVRRGAAGDVPGDAPEDNACGTRQPQTIEANTKFLSKAESFLLPRASDIAAVFPVDSKGDMFHEKHFSTRPSPLGRRRRGPQDTA